MPDPVAREIVQEQTGGQTVSEIPSWTATENISEARDQLRSLGAIPEGDVPIATMKKTGNNLQVIRRRVGPEVRDWMDNPANSFRLKVSSAMEEGVDASYETRRSVSTSVIELNKLSKQKPSSKRPVIGNFTVDASRSGSIRHEYGHHLHAHFVGEDNQEWLALYNKYADSDAVSTYGRGDPFEFFAESFSAATHPKYKAGREEGWGRLPTDVEDFLNRVLGMSL